MKPDFYVCPPDFACGETIARWPILDWEGWTGKNLTHRSFRKFTGKIYNYAYVSVCLFRYKFVFTLEWGVRNVKPEEAEKLFHAQRAKKKESL